MIGGEELGSYVQMYELVSTHKICSQLFHLLGPSSRPHQHLSVRPNLTENLSDLGFEPHIQHTISFIQNYIGATSEISFSHLKKSIIYMKKMRFLILFAHILNRVVYFTAFLFVTNITDS